MDRELEQKFYSPLYLAYREGTPEGRGLFAGRHTSLSSYGEKADFVRENFPGEKRKALRAALTVYNTSLETGPKAFENIDLMEGQEALAVVTGQQAGILGGPLYTFYKAAAAVALAGKMSRELGAPVLPVFWIAAEDHDFREVNHLYLQDREGNPRKVELPPRFGPHALEHLPLDREGARDFLGEFCGYLPDTEFKEEILERIQGHLRESSSLTQWFGRLMAWLFHDSGLVFFNPLMPGIRTLAAPLLASVALRRTEVNRALVLREKEIADLGFPLQVKREEGHLHLFAFLPGGRAALLWKKGRVITRQGESLGTLKDLAMRIQAESHKFGPGVLTRPLLQEELLPVLSYIGGPGEVSYYAQIQPLFPLFSLKAPVLYPRPSLTLVEPRMADYMKRYGLQEEDLFRVRDAREAYLHAQGRDSMDQAFSALAKKIREEYRGLEALLERVDRGLKPLAGKNLNRVLQEVAYLEGKGQQALKEKHKRAVRHFESLENACLPAGRLQERAYNIFPYLVKYGPDFLRGLREDFPLDGVHCWYRW